MLENKPLGLTIFCEFTIYWSVNTIDDMLTLSLPAFEGQSLHGTQAVQVQAETPWIVGINDPHVHVDHVKPGVFISTKAPDSAVHNVRPEGMCAFRGSIGD